jgi:hypothetical protein
VPPVAPSPPGGPTGPAAASGLTGVWTGSYVCAQGLTELTLTISASVVSERVTAIFRFSAHATNPDVPSGSYLMRGTYVDGVLNLKGESWLRRPGNYEMVGLTADVRGERPAAITGTIDDAPGCTTFSVRR